MRIRKAVIAVAGYGTRFLPATKVLPKEMIPIVDKPIVQYLVEEAVESGIEEILFVTRSGSQAIADHFDRSLDLEGHLEAQSSNGYLEMIRAIPDMAKFKLVRQPSHLPYGNGSPLLADRSFLDKNDPFVFMFGDDLVLSDKPCVGQLIETYEAHRPGAVIAVQEVPREETCRYGIVKPKPGSDPMEMESIVEKPNPEDAPSTLAQFGRFILTPQVVDVLERTPRGKGNELYLTDALDQFSRENRVLVQQVEGTWLTTGDPLRFLKATVEYALKRTDIGADFADFLHEVVAARSKKS